MTTFAELINATLAHCADGRFDWADAYWAAAEARALGMLQTAKDAKQMAAEMAKITGKSLAMCEEETASARRMVDFRLDTKRA